MTHKSLIFFAIMICLFLTGCNDTIDYASDLFKPDQATCWPCQMYMMAFNGISSALEGSLTLICENTFKVMTLALAFWLMYKALPMVLSFSPPNFKEDFVTITKVLFKAMIVGLFLANPNYFYTQIGDKIIQPLGSIFLQVSELVLTSPNTVGVNTSQYAQTQNSFLSGLMEWAQSAGNWDISLFNSSSVSNIIDRLESSFSRTRLPNGREISVSLHDPMFGQLPMQILSVVWQIYSALWSGMGLAFQLMRSDYFVAWLAAIALAGSLFFLLVCLPLSFVDAFIRLGVGVMLMPIFMAIWVFPVQMFKGLMKKLVELILGAFFDILFNCIYVAFLISILRIYVDTRLPHIFNTDYQISESQLRESGVQLSWNYLLLLVLILTVFRLSEKVDDITGRFFGGAGQGTSIRSTIIKTGQMAVLTAVAATRVVMSGGMDWGGFKKVASKGGEMLKEGAEDMNAEQEKWR